VFLLFKKIILRDVDIFIWRPKNHRPKLASFHLYEEQSISELKQIQGFCTLIRRKNLTNGRVAIIYHTQEIKGENTMINKKSLQKKIVNAVIAIVAAYIGGDCDAMFTPQYPSVKSPPTYKLCVPLPEDVNGTPVNIDNLFDVLFVGNQKKAPTTPGKALFDDIEFEEYINRNNSPSSRNTNNVSDDESASLISETDSANRLSLSPPALSPTPVEPISIQHISRDKDDRGYFYPYGEGIDLEDDGEIMKAFYLDTYYI
jgi:hypothetical protein